jgi:ammonium transporter, Amt family
MRLQLIAVGACVGFSFVATLVIGKVLDLVMGLRLSRDQELEGMDTVLHAETAYEFGSVHGGSFGGGFSPPGHVPPGTVAAASTGAPMMGAES